jgi:hypothetical protein
MNKRRLQRLEQALNELQKAYNDLTVIVMRKNMILKTYLIINQVQNLQNRL